MAWQGGILRTRRAACSASTMDVLSSSDFRRRPSLQAEPQIVRSVDRDGGCHLTRTPPPASGRSLGCNWKSLVDCCRYLGPMQQLTKTQTCRHLQENEHHALLRNSTVRDQKLMTLTRRRKQQTKQPSQGG